LGKMGDKGELLQEIRLIRLFPKGGDEGGREKVEKPSNLGKLEKDENYLPKTGEKVKTSSSI